LNIIVISTSAWISLAVLTDVPSVVLFLLLLAFPWLLFLLSISLLGLLCLLLSDISHLRNLPLLVEVSCLQRSCSCLSVCPLLVGSLHVSLAQVLSNLGVQGVHIQGELDCITGRSRPQVVLTSLETLLPCEHVRGTQLGVTGLGEIDVQALGLANVRCSGPCKLDELLLADLPDCLVDILVFLGESGQVLD